MSISNVYLECGVGHRLNDSAFHFDHVGFCQVLSLLVLITAAYRGDGFTKLTICDGFVASDPLGNRAPIAPEQRRVFAPLALRPFHGPRLSVRQQEEVSLRRKHEEEASRVRKGFENSFLLPYPKKEAVVTVALKNVYHKVSTSLTHEVNPNDILIHQRGLARITPHRYLLQSGSSKDCIDVAIMAEGYTEQEMDLFYKDAQTACDALFSHEPFKKLKNKFNVVAVASPGKKYS